MECVRTILGDVQSAGLGACGTHEHVVIDSPHMAKRYPAFRLSDAERIAKELRAFRAAGGGAMVDTMPGGAGRCGQKLAEVSRRTGVHVIAATGLHLPQYYPDDDPRLMLDEDGLAALFIHEISHGFENTGTYRAGVIKVAGGRDRLTDRQRVVFITAARAHTATGCSAHRHTISAASTGSAMS